MRFPVGPLLVLVVLNVSGCGGSPAAPGCGSTPTTPSPPAGLRTLAISGNSDMQAVGETTRLTAIASFSDNTTRDVTAEAIWSSARPSLVSVAAGVVTVLSYGVADVSAFYTTRTASRQIVATPANTFVFFGRAREPGMSGLPSVRVLETGSNRSVMTDQNGQFQIAALASARTFKFDRDGYENTEVVPEVGTGPLIFVESAMQRVVRLAAGQSLSNALLAPHDVAYTIGSGSCYPCRLIRVTTASAGTLRLTVTGASANFLHIWVNGKRFDATGSVLGADVQAGAGEVPVYVGWDLPLSSGGSGNYTNFSLLTAAVGS